MLLNNYWLVLRELGMEEERGGSTWMGGRERLGYG